MYTVIGMNSICNPNLKHKGVQFLEVSRVYKHLRFTPVPLTNPKITFEVFKIWKMKTIFVVKSQMTQFFEDSLLELLSLLKLLSFNFSFVSFSSPLPQDFSRGSLNLSYYKQ